SRIWNEADDDIIITCYFKPDIFELAQSLRNWCKKPNDEFPFSFSQEEKPDHITRSVMTIRLMKRRDHVWYHDRPFIFEFRPINRQEAYELEARYWQANGDKRRSELAQELSK